jgi:AhpD family alkylhydroperoxidase
MSLVPYVEKSDSTPRVAAVYHRLEAKYNGKLFNTFKMMGHMPEVLEAFVPFAEALIEGGQLDRRLKELIILSATLSNKSNYCATHHFYAAKLAGLRYEEIADIHRYKESPHFTEKEKLVMAFTEDVTRHPGEVNADLRARIRREYDPALLVEIVALIGMSNFLNRFDDTLALELDLPPAPAAFYPKREEWMRDDDI